MNATSTSAPNLRYIVKWRRRGRPAKAWVSASPCGAPDTWWGRPPIYVPYEIRVQAENDFRKGPEPDTVAGYSGRRL